MHIASKSDVSLNDGKLVTEASSISLKPGVWPALIAVLDEKDTGFVFLKSDPILFQGELGGYNYRANNGAVLLVFND